MDKEALLGLVARARKRAEDSDTDIAAQQQIIAYLEGNGLDAAKARKVLANLIAAQDGELAEMERLLDVMDNAC